MNTIVSYALDLLSQFQNASQESALLIAFGKEARGRAQQAEALRIRKLLEGLFEEAYYAAP
jgi:hypothetical protein